MFRQKKYDQMTQEEKEQFSLEVTRRVADKITDFSSEYLSSLSEQRRGMVHSVVVTIVPEKHSVGQVSVLTRPDLVREGKIEDGMMTIAVLRSAKSEIEEFIQDEIRAIGFDPDVAAQTRPAILQ